MIRIVMADDHDLVREGIRALLEDEPGFEILAECATSDDTLQTVSRLRPDVLILDLKLPPGGGLGIVPELRQAVPEMAIVVFTMHSEGNYVAEALRRGVHGYVTKAVAKQELFDALRAVTSGQPYLSSDIRATRRSSDLNALTERETEVFLRLAAFAKPKRIALELGISDKAVYQHRASIWAKLGAHGDADLHRIALERGLLP